MPFEADDIVVFVIPGDVPSEGNPNPNIAADGDVQTGTQIQNIIVYDTIDDYNNGVVKYTYVGENPGQTGSVQLDNQTSDITFKANVNGLVPDASSTGAPQFNQLYIAPQADFQPGETQIFPLVDDEDFNSDGDEVDSNIGEPGDGDFNIGGLDPVLNPEIHPGPVCFTRGTLISTPDGQKRIEDLAPGDLVDTLDNGPQPIRWIGSRRLGRRELKFNPDFFPVTITAGALGPARPAADLTVSPLHRLMIRSDRADLLFGEPEILVFARDLVDGRTVYRDTGCGEVEYIHLLFDRHEIVVSNGTPSESLHPSSYTLDNATAEARRELLALFPDLARPDRSWPAARRTLKRTETEILSAL